MENQRHQSVSEGTEKMLLRGLEAIAENVIQFDMNHWVKEKGAEHGGRTVEDWLKLSRECGTLFCFAGFLLTLAPTEWLKARAEMDIPHAAAELAGLTLDQWYVVFLLDKWPPEIRAQYFHACGVDRRRKEFAALKERVSYFIRTGE